jgi:hypothetical protein
VEANEDFVPLAQQEIAEYIPFTTDDIFYAWKQATNERRPLADVKSSSMDRSPEIEHKYYNGSDNIDVPTTYPNLKSINEENEENEENYIPAEETRAPLATSPAMTRAKTQHAYQKARAKRRTSAEIQADLALLAENKLRNAKQKQAVKDAEELERSNRREQKALSKAIADERKEAEKKLPAFAKTKTTKTTTKNAPGKFKFK